MNKLADRNYKLMRKIRRFEQWAQKSGFNLTVHIASHGDYTQDPAVITNTITITELRPQ